MPYSGFDSVCRARLSDHCHLDSLSHYGLCDSERNHHLLAVLRSAASPAGRILPWRSIPTRHFQWRDASTWTAGFQSGSLGLRYSPHRLFRPLWTGRPAFSPSPHLRNVFLRSSFRGGGTDAAGPPAGPCCLGSLGCRGGACSSPPTWSRRHIWIKFQWKVWKVLCAPVLFCKTQ